MYSSIFSCRKLRESDGERSSTTKSGHIGGKLVRWLFDRAFHLSFDTHARSGDLLAPFGSEKTVDESKLFPLPSCFDQAQKLPFNSKFRMPVSPPVGGITTRSPSLVSSRRRCSLILKNWKHSSSLRLFRNVPKRSTSGPAFRSVGVSVAVMAVSLSCREACLSSSNPQERRAAEGGEQDDADEGVRGEERRVEAAQVVCAHERVLVDEERARQQYARERQRAELRQKV